MDDETPIVWPGRLGRTMRQVSVGELRRALSVVLLMFAAGAAAAVPLVVGLVDIDGVNRAVLALVAAAAFLYPVAVLPILRGDTERLVRWAPTIAIAGIVTAIVGVALAVVGAGPKLGVAAVYIVEMPLLAFFILRVRWALTATALLMVSYALALVALDGAEAPVQQWFIVLSSAALSGWLVGSIATRLDVARAVEARAKAGLSRFLSAQIADVVTSEGSDAMLAPHRAEIAAFFVDLRGFTAFTNRVSADRVMEVLDEYYGAVGSVLDRYDATIGGFDGDGVFAYLGDPIARDDAAGAAIAMAKDVATALDRLTPEWGELGYGIGLAYGEATLGRVGYEGRVDYTPVGAVVNLAARLCGQAKHREIVIDDAMKQAAGLSRLRRRRAVDLKGFGEVATYGVAH